MPPEAARPQDGRQEGAHNENEHDPARWSDLDDLAAAVRDAWSAGRDAPPPSPDALPASVRETLRTLGYVE